MPAGLIPIADLTYSAPQILPIGAKVMIHGVLHKLATVIGRQQTFVRLDKLGSITLAWNQYVQLWNDCALVVLSPKGDLSASKSRVADIPFEFFGERTQQAINLKLHYCMSVDLALIEKTLACRSKDVVEAWLKDLPLPEGRSEHPSRGTVLRDYAFWIASGKRRSVLAHGNAGAIRDSVFGKIVEDIIYDVIETYAAPNPDFSLDNIRAEIAEEIGRRIADGELIADRVPANSTIASYIKKLNQYEVVRLNEGVYEADRQFQPKGKIVVPDFPHSRWEIDHTLLPVKVAVPFKDQHGVVQWIVVGSVWCTAVIDASTRFVLAIVLGVDPPSSLRTMRALRMAISPKSDLFIEHGVENRLDICMLPVMVVMDNGKDLHSGEVSAILNDLGITQAFAGTFRGDHKPFIERWFRTFKAFLRKIPGSTHKGLPKRGPKRRDIDPAKPITLQQLEMISWKWSSDTYHARPHSGLFRQTPLAVMEGGLRRLQVERSRGYPAPMRSFSEYSSLDIEAMFAIRRTLHVSDQGVRYANLFWNSGALRSLDLKSVQARINPENLGTILVFNPKTHSFLRVGSTMPFYTEGTSLSHHKRVWARILQHAKATMKSGGRPRVNIQDYLKNECALLREILELTGQPKVATKALRGTVASLGQQLDIAVACARLDAIDVQNGRVPPGMESTIDLDLQDDGTYSIAPRDIAPKVKRKEFTYPAEPSMPTDEEVDITNDPVAGFDPESV